MAARDYLILFALADGPLHGHGLLKQLEAEANGVPFDPANLYRSLRKLERDALVVEARCRVGRRPGPPRRAYRLTRPRPRRTRGGSREALSPGRRRAAQEAGSGAMTRKPADARRRRRPPVARVAGRAVPRCCSSAIRARFARARRGRRVPVRRGLPGRLVARPRPRAGTPRGRRARHGAARRGRRAPCRAAGAHRARPSARSASGAPALIGDVRYAIRSIRRRPMLSATIAGTLAIGIGTNTAVFSVIDATLLRPTPYVDARRVVSSRPRRRRASRDPKIAWARTWAAASQSIERVEARRWRSALITGAGSATRKRIIEATSGYLPAIGARPIAGRLLVPADSLPGAPPVAVIAPTFWRSQFGQRPDVVGATIALDGIAHQIVGVASDLESDVPGLTFSLATALPDAADVRFAPWRGSGRACRSRLRRRTSARCRLWSTRASPSGRGCLRPTTASGGSRSSGRSSSG